MFRGPPGSKPNGPAEHGDGLSGVANNVESTAPPARPSGAFAAAQKAPVRSLIVVIPAGHALAFDRVAARQWANGEADSEVIVACAGQPPHATVTAIHAHLRNAQFLLAPAQTTAGDLRVLAYVRAAGDIITIVDGVPDGQTGADRAQMRNAPGPGPAVSVVVPAHNGGTMLDDALSAIIASDMPRESYDLVVVDDASSDGSPPNAARYADTMVRLKSQPRGAAYARNRGADQARGDVLVFVDADVRVRPDTIGKLLATLAANPQVGAVGASCDGTSGDGGVPTQYWNLLQQFGAQAHGGHGIHFEAACGAVRRAALAKSGMFNEWLYLRPSVEDLELGSKLHQNGYQVLLRRDVAVSHLKSHSIRGVIAAAWRRSSHLTRTLGYGATRPLATADIVHTLNSAVGLAAFGTLLTLVVTALDPRPATFAASAVAVGLVVGANAQAFRFFMRRRGLTFAIAAAPLHVAAQIAALGGRCHGWILRNAIGDPSPDATTQAFSEVGVQIWPPVPRKR